MDIAEFTMIRPLREVADDAVVRLTETKVLTPYTDPGSVDHVPQAGEPLVLGWDSFPEDMLGDKGVDPLAGDGGGDFPSMLQQIYELVLQLDKYLALGEDVLDGEDLEKTEQKLLAKLDLDAVDWKPAFSVDLDQTALYVVALFGYRRALVEELSKQVPDYDRAMRLTRLALVAALFELEREALKGLSREQVSDRLNRWPVVLDKVVSGQLTREPKVKLVREAKKSDLYVVRREWAGYVAGEIANIRNVMAGETFRQRDFTTTEVETTTTTEVDVRRETESEEETKVSSELSSEVNSQLGVTINGHAETSAEFTYSMLTASVSAGVDAGFSMQRSERQARKSAKEAVSRAVSRVDSRTRETRARRELMRTEQGYVYGLDNKDGDNLHGVYRWVDRIDTYQTFRFPDRLLLEFQIPDPAEFYRWRTQQAADTEGDPPPDWDTEFKPESISLDKPGELMALAKTYRATNLPPPPDKEISVARTVSVEVGNEWAPTNFKTEVWNPPTATKEVTIPITPNYEATAVSWEGVGYPLLGTWLESTSNQGHPGSSLWGYRSGFVAVSVGGKKSHHWEGGSYSDGGRPALLNVDEVQAFPLTPGAAQSEVEYGRAVLEIPASQGEALDPATRSVSLTPGARDEIKLAVTASGLAQCTLSVLTKCTLTKEAEHAWKLAVYDTLYNAWASWKRDYESSLVRNMFASEPVDAGSSQRNELTIREELKREAISWLLDESPFLGRPGRKATTTKDFDDVDVDQARHDATVIQFLEQAFEWNNMSWAFYPYYWAKRKDWQARTQLVSNDPDFERFLRSGSARVILSARPGFEVAVDNWLATGVPFLSGHLPAVDEPLYVRIDTEIRELTSPREGGYAGDTWQNQVSTTMLYLEEKGDLPFINGYHQLPAAKGEWYKPEPIIKFPVNP